MDLKTKTRYSGTDNCFNAKFCNNKYPYINLFFNVVNKWSEQRLSSSHGLHQFMDFPWKQRLLLQFYEQKKKPKTLFYMFNSNKENYICNFKRKENRIKSLFLRNRVNWLFYTVCIIIIRIFRQIQRKCNKVKNQMNHIYYHLHVQHHCKNKDNNQAQFFLSTTHIFVSFQQYLCPVMVNNELSHTCHLSQKVAITEICPGLLFLFHNPFILVIGADISYFQQSFILSSCKKKNNNKKN